MRKFVIRAVLFLPLLALLCYPLAAPWHHLYLREKVPYLSPDQSTLQYHLNAVIATPFAFIEYLRYGEADFSKQKLIALTFDDGPYPLYTPLLLDVLARYKVHATFFLVGNTVLEYPNLVRQIHLGGHEIANHTFDHHRQRDMKLEDFRAEIIRTEEAIELVTGDRPHLFRPAGGAVTPEGQALLQDLGYGICNATINPGDWWQRDPERLIHSSYRGRSREGMTLMHSGTLGIIRAMPGYINALKAKGFEFVTVSELARRTGHPFPTNPRAHPQEMSPTLISPGSPLQVEPDGTGGTVKTPPGPDRSPGPGAEHD